MTIARTGSVLPSTAYHRGTFKEGLGPLLWTLPTADRARNWAIWTDIGHSTDHYFYGFFVCAIATLSHEAYDSNIQDQNTTCIPHPARVEQLIFEVRHSQYIPDNSFLFPGLSNDSFLVPPGEDEQ